MKIAILGTRGIPNAYGGFEQFAEYLSLGLIEKGHDVTVYNSHNHSFQGDNWNGVDIVHCYDPEYMIGTAGQFIYDLNCILDCRKKRFDVILQLGYTSSSVWLKRFLNKKKFVVTTNMDGHEWKRSKYSPTVKKFLRYAEKLAVNDSSHLISDSVTIKSYLKNKYNKNSTFIPYGAYVFNTPDPKVLREYDLTAYNYDALIARLEPDNSIEVILDGVAKSSANRPFLVIGNCETKYGLYLKNKFAKNENVRFLNGIYDINVLNNLRYFSNLYFHGHTVGGTNPSLLEAMASSALICAHDNQHNSSILCNDAFYFKTADEVKLLLDSVDINESANQERVLNNIRKIESSYTWETIIDQYIAHFRSIAGQEEPAREKSTWPMAMAEEFKARLNSNSEIAVPYK
jgi:glycosyltransferase involved in cell wall biosynthesis